MRGSKAEPHKESTVRGKLLNIEEASAHIHMSKEWLYKRMQTGTLPFRWFMPSPGKRLFDSHDLDVWLSAIEIPVGKTPGNK